MTYCKSCLTRSSILIFIYMLHKQMGEIDNHIFLPYLVTLLLKYKLFNMAKLASVSPDTILELMIIFCKDSGNTSKSKELQRINSHALWWTM